jgi:hypothetical protein
MGTYFGISDALVPNPPEGVKPGAEVVLDETMEVDDEPLVVPVEVSCARMVRAPHAKNVSTDTLYIVVPKSISWKTTEEA